jgi:hypothetical protein
MSVNLEEFINFVDPDNTIDFAQTVVIFTNEGYARAIEETFPDLDEHSKKRINKLITVDENVNIGQLINIYSDIGKEDILLEKAVNKIEDLRNEYFTQHIENTSEENREKIFERFPELRKLDNLS